MRPTRRKRSLARSRMAHLGVGMLLVVPAGPGAIAAVPAGPEHVGRWTAPFEEGGAAVPRCVPAEDESDFLVCKPTAQAAALLPDGRVFYYNGLESWRTPKSWPRPTASPPRRGTTTW